MDHEHGNTIRSGEDSAPDSNRTDRNQASGEPVVVAEQPACPMDSGADDSGNGSVSYTHLDVYKRQHRGIRDDYGPVPMAGEIGVPVMPGGMDVCGAGETGGGINPGDIVVSGESTF